MINIIKKHAESNKDFSVLLEMLLDAIMVSTIVYLIFKTVLSFIWKLPSRAKSGDGLDSSSDIIYLWAGILCRGRNLFT